ncbi:MAG: phytanoyl-CoA dioxygenase family protein [Gammaproteobacteria bacterium]|nr:phytanoyl-CoA dioxygenase family protein [Gammaproteobacteria bacterium]
MKQTIEEPAVYIRDDYARDGYAILDFNAGPGEVAEVERYIAARVRDGHEGNIYDGKGRLRALHGYDKRSGMLAELMERFADVSKALLDCEHVYIYQFRVNVKNGVVNPADTLGSWKPHRDFDYWQKMDGMQEPRAVIFHMLVNEHHSENGPLEVCPGTHLSELDDGELVVASDTGWKAGFSENIKYQIDGEAFSRRRVVPLHGEPGTLLAMHPKLWHGSSSNRTAQPRILLSIIFNDLANAVTTSGRPPFIVQSPALGTW